MEKKPSLLQKLASAQYIVWSVIFIIAPLILVVYYAFTDARHFYGCQHSTAGQLWQHLSSSIGYGLAATIACCLLSVCLSPIQSRASGRAR